MRITMSTIANIFSVIYLGYISMLIFFYAKGKIKLMLNPILSIIQGILVTFSVNYLFLTLIQNISTINIYIMGMILAFSIFIGGFVATIFCRENKTLFGVLTGIIFAGFILIVDYKDFMAYNITMKITMGIIIVLIVSLLPGGFGGFIARLSKESIIKRIDSHIDEYIYCIGRCASLNSRYNQLINGENIHITDFIYECEDLLGKFNGLNDLGQSNEINKSIMIGTVKNMIVHVKRNYIEK
jgi:hypothetical protein